MRDSRIKYFGLLGAAMLIIVADQITKTIAYSKLLGQPAIDVLPVLQWALVFNYGRGIWFFE